MMPTMTKEGIIQYLKGICMEEGIVPNKDVINTCFRYIIIRPQMLDAQERGYKTFFTIEIPYEIPEFFMNEEQYEHLYIYDKEYQMNWLYPYLRDHYLPNVMIDEPTLKGSWVSSYRYIGRHNKKTILNVWQEAIKSDKITPHIENEDFQEIKIGSIKPRTLTEIVEMKERKIQNEPDFYFSNIELNNDIMAPSEIHIFNNKYYKSFRLTNFKNQWKALLENKRGNEFRYIIESKMCISKDYSKKDPIKVTDIEQFKWKFVTIFEDKICICFKIYSPSLKKDYLTIDVNIVKNTEEDEWRITDISLQGFGFLDELDIKGTEIEEKTYKSLLRERKENLV